MKCLRAEFLSKVRTYKSFTFRAYESHDRAMDKFSKKDWSRIVSWINSEETIIHYAEEMPFSMAFLSYIHTVTRQPFAFILLLRDHPDNNIITFHGGAWGNAFVNLRCGKHLIETLRNCRFKIRTCVKVENIRAQKFVEALGLRKSTRKKDVFWYIDPVTRHYQSPFRNRKDCLDSLDN